LYIKNQFFKNHNIYRDNQNNEKQVSDSYLRPMPSQNMLT
jgi:hypothetical protein